MTALPEPMRVGVIGVGAISDVFITTMRDRFRILDVRACAARNPDRVRAAADRYGIAPMTVAEMLDDPSIELVVNLTPPQAHQELIVRALEAGKHVYTEKVLATTVQQGRELVETADRLGLELCASPDTFLGSALQNARQLVDRRMLGTVTSAQASLTRNYRHMAEFLPFVAQQCGDIGIDVAVYHLTALVHLLGPIESVFGFGVTNDAARRYRLPALPHFGEAYTVTAKTVTAGCVRFASGALATLLFDADSIRNQRPRFEVNGTLGVMNVPNPDDFGGEVVLQREGQDAPSPVPSTFGMTTNLRGAGVAEMAWAIRRGRRPRANKELAFHVLEALLGIADSGANGAPHTMRSTVDRIPPLPEGHVGDPFIDDIESAFAE